MAIFGPSSRQIANRHRPDFPLHYRKWPVFIDMGHFWPTLYLQMRRPDSELINLCFLLKVGHSVFVYYILMFISS